MLTTGILLENAEKQRKFIGLLAEAGVAGLGFGTGFSHAKVPKAILTEAESAGFPVFEVPYETPFIAITEAAFSRLVNEQYDVLSRGIAVNERLERLVLQGGGLDEVAREIAAAIGGSSVVLDARGEVLANGGRRLPNTSSTLSARRWCRAARRRRRSCRTSRICEAGLSPIPSRRAPARPRPGSWSSGALESLATSSDSACSRPRSLSRSS